MKRAAPDSLGVRHGAACVLEGLPQAVPCLLSDRSAKGSAFIKSQEYRPPHQVSQGGMPKAGMRSKPLTSIKGHLDPEELDAVAIESKRIIDIDRLNEWTCREQGFH
jgi:hypothetical protein